MKSFLSKGNTNARTYPPSLSKKYNIEFGNNDIQYFLLIVSSQHILKINNNSPIMIDRTGYWQIISKIDSFNIFFGS